jgi:transposase
MLDALISGTNDPEILAELAKGSLRRKIPALREALSGRFTGHHALLVSQMLAQIDFLAARLADARADRLPGRSDRDPVAAHRGADPPFLP